MNVIGIGIVGTGDIAPRYLEGIMASARLRPIGCAGRLLDRARVLAQRFAIDAFTIDELLANPNVSVIVNLSAPRDHADVTAAALRANKHVYSEKPLAASEAEADNLIALAEAQGCVLASAPATRLGPMMQTARAVIDAGEIGDIVGAIATMIYPGPELFHHHPASLYARGAGPLYDMAVYDVAALHHLLGPVTRVSAMTRRMRRERETLHGPDKGSRFLVEVPTHIVATLAFADGPVATLTTSFDAHGGQMPALDLYGTRGMLRLGRASAFEGQVLLSTAIDQWREIPSSMTGWSDDLWIIGLLDLIEAIETERTPACCAHTARHALAILSAIERAAAESRVIEVGHAAARPLALAMDTYHRLRGAAACSASA